MSAGVQRSSIRIRAHVAPIKYGSYAVVMLVLATVAGQSAYAQAAPTITLTDSIQDVLRRDNDPVRLQDEKVNGAGPIYGTQGNGEETRKRGLDK